MQYFKTTELKIDNARLTEYTRPAKDALDVLYKLAVIRNIAPPDGATNVSRIPRFEIEPIKILEPKERYYWEIASDASFNNIVYKVRNTETSLLLPKELDGFTTYYWRVTLQNTFQRQEIFVTSVTVSGPSSVDEGSTVQMVATLDGVGNYSTDVNWSVSPSSAATINSAGVLQGNVGGESVIVTAESVETPGVSDTKTVTVNSVAQPAPTGEMIVWDATTDPAPIYVPSDAPPLVKEAANDLSYYIGLASGKTAPTVIEQSSGLSVPQRSIRVGYPVTTTKEEETVVGCVDGGPITLSGSDEYDPSNPNYIRGSVNEGEYMAQAGTYHAVMSFLHEEIGIVWGFPGDLGEAIPSKSELSVSEKETRHTPSCIDRHTTRFSDIGNNSPYGISKEWNKRQRSFFSKTINIGHDFSSFYNDYHPDGNNGNPRKFPQIDIFALQPDGTRSGFPFGSLAKLELGNPDLPQFFYDNFAVPALETNPHTTSFNVSENDSWLRGTSVDPRAKAMDYPPQGYAKETSTDTVIDCQNTPSTPFTVNEFVGETVKITEGVNGGQERTVVSNTEDSITVSSPFSSPIDSTSFYFVDKNDTEYFPRIYENGLEFDAPSTSDRIIKFTKRCVDVIEQTYPNMLVATQAYGSNVVAPKRETVDGYDNLVVQSVHNDFTDPTENPNFTEWRNAFPAKYIWRPNLRDGYGQNVGCFYVHIHAIGNKYKGLIDDGVIGAKPDTLWEHWATQWPLYYVLHQLSWDSTQDVDAIMDKAYTTLFPNSHTHIKAYYEYAESRIDANYESFTRPENIREFWSVSTIQTLQGYLDSALQLNTPGTDEYQRIEWIQRGLNWVDAMRQMSQYYYDYTRPATSVSSTNLATLANAIEDGTDATTGWEDAYVNINDPLEFLSVTDEGSPAFLVNNDRASSGGDTSKGIIRNSLPLTEEITGQATSGDSNTLVDSSKSFSVNSQVNRILRVTSGTNAGEEAQIISNTSDTIEVKYPFSQPVDNTSVYEIIDLYLVSVDIKHVGIGGSWIAYTDFSRNESITPDQTEYKTIQFYGYSGDPIIIRELNSNNDGALYIKNLVIEKAVPIDRPAIKEDWENHLSQALDNYVYDNTYGVFRPIGLAADRDLFYPANTNYGEPEPGFI